MFRGFRILSWEAERLDEGVLEDRNAMDAFHRKSLIIRNEAFP